MFSSNPKPLPQRTHSVNAVKHANYFGTVDEEVRDCKRVQRQGQEEDLRLALGRMMARVEEMCVTLKSSYQTTADLETQLKVAQSNLKLEQANTEMLEDALKSSSLSTKDVGWRRSSREAGSLQAVPSSSPPVSAAMPASQPQSQRTSVDESQTQQGALESPNSDRDSRPSSPAPTTTQNDSRYFGFRFSGSGRSTPTQPPGTPRPSRSSQTTVGRLTSASLPSLAASSPSIADELEDLRGQLLDEKRKSEKISHEKKELESELESLSQALFEEANKMVKVERIKRAEAEDELREVHSEKAALRAALRLIEDDRVRTENSHAPPHANGAVTPPRRSHSRTSSCEAIVSPRAARDSSRPPSPPPPTAQSRSQSPGGIPATGGGSGAPDSDGEANAAPASPAPLYVPPPHLEDEAPASRTGSPMPLPHPHRDRLSIQRLAAAAAPPAPPPPSAADGFPDTPWARDAPFGSARYEDEDEDEGIMTELGLSVPRIVTYASPSEAENPVPWGTNKW